MAKPIAPTPILRDKEAEEFIREIDNPKAQKVSSKEVTEAKKIFEAVQKNLRVTKHANI